MVTFAEESSNPKPLAAYRFAPELGWIPAESPSALDFPASPLHLVTWNIDAERDFPEKRLARAITHLHKKVFGGRSPPPPCCLLLQEVHEDVLPALLESRWIREYFLVTPITTEGWTTPYGLVTLISTAVPVSTVFLIELPKTTVGRHALFVDIHLSGLSSERKNAKKGVRVHTVRIANTHLEPDPSGARVRPKQLEAIARMLNVPDIDGYICAGSMSSFQESDKTAPSKAGFADAYKGSKRDSMTWGYQPRTQMPPCRLDKVLYFPTEHVEVGCPERIGFRTMLTGGEYVSDHCGLSATIKVLDDQ